MLSGVLGSVLTGECYIVPFHCNYRKIKCSLRITATVAIIYAYMYTYTYMKPIPGLDGLYSATKDGKIYSHPRLLHSDISTLGDYYTQGRYLKQYDNDGYLYVTIRPVAGSKKRLNMRVHRLVAFAFLPNPNPKKFYQINHIDGDKKNNHVTNLEWSNHSLNQKHAWDVGLNKRGVIIYA